MKITSNECKEAIVEYVRKNPGCIKKEYSDPNSIIESKAYDIKTWRRFEIEKLSENIFRRGFQCISYGDGDELRAYTIDNKSEILKVEICGE
jgi:hypothetical protein